jgi:hypothetical protein
VTGMGRVSTRIKILRQVIWIVPILAIFAGAQSFPTSQEPGQVSPRGRNPFDQPPAGSDPLYEERRMSALNADRHKSLVSDAEKLLQLAKRLDAEIAANTTDGLTSKEVKEVAEIEKLARSVKEKMARSYGGGPLYREPANPMIP